jgi:signal transduction histidine kinase
MRATDPRVREILDRSMALSQEQMLGLHGAVRELRPLELP